MWNVARQHWPEYLTKAAGHWLHYDLGSTESIVAVTQACCLALERLPTRPLLAR
jgi:hypothetical protein